MILAATLLVATTATAATAAPDPRPAIVALAREHRFAEALALVDGELREREERARSLGLDLLRGDLLERSGRERDAVEAFVDALSPRSPLAPWARYRLALAQQRMGHPEVAAGLIATLLARDPPASLVERSLDLLDRLLDEGGDCRLLRGVPRERFTGSRRRTRELMEMRCQSSSWKESERLGAVKDFLAESTVDAPAWRAALLVDDAPPNPADRNAELLLGLTAFHHRAFERALSLLAPWVERGPQGPFDSLAREAAYAAARSAFWLGNFAEAAHRFEEIANGSRDPSERSDALHQRARALELAGDAAGALESFDRAYHEDPSGDWAGAALLSALRIEYLNGNESAARRRLTDLASGPRFSSLTARGALFIAVSDLMRGRTRGIAPLLALAERTREISPVEIGYWRGRLAENQNDSEKALDEYLHCARERPFHPLARAARSRIASRPALAAAAAVRLPALLAHATPENLWAAAFLARDAERGDLRRRGAALLAGSGGSSGPWIEGGFVPVESWPIWASGSNAPEELVLGLGLADLAPGAVSATFAWNPPRLGLTGAALLTGGAETRAGLSIAESIFSRRPRSAPLDWVASDWLQTLYPLPWADLVVGQATAHRIEPALLAAILREESRFDPRAESPAAARGLAQLILPTARRLARATRRADLQLDDLADPGTSIALGAAYLSELAQRFRGEPTAIAAAYNAGEDQAGLWLRSCITNEPEELLAKISFAETRAYVTRVLESRDAYAVLRFGGR